MLSASNWSPATLNRASTHAQAYSHNPKGGSMSRIKLNLSTLTIPEKIAKAEQIVAAITGNGSFATPSPSLTSVTTAKTDLDQAFAAAQAARQTAKEKTAVQNQKEDALDRLLKQLAAYVE